MKLFWTFFQFLVFCKDDENKSLKRETRSYPYLEYYENGISNNRCPSGTECTALHECTPLLYEVAKKCYYNDKSMFCGQNQELPRVCCPSNPLEQNQVCGRSLVQGQFYRGLGTYPFVVRIGFKGNLQQNLQLKGSKKIPFFWNLIIFSIDIGSGNLSYLCAGSIISRRVILTAAHCALAKSSHHRL